MIETSVTSMLDIDARQLDEDLVRIIERSNHDYRDNVLKEHLYGVSSLEDLMKDELVSISHKQTIQTILELMGEKACAYLRIISW